MKTRIHVNQHSIWANRKGKPPVPVISVKNASGNTYCNRVAVDGPCVVVYRPDKPLPCGATVWIETEAEVVIGE